MRLTMFGMVAVATAILCTVGWAQSSRGRLSSAPSAVVSPASGAGSDTCTGNGCAIGATGHSTDGGVLAIPYVKIKQVTGGSHAEGLVFMNANGTINWVIEKTALTVGDLAIGAGGGAHLLLQNASGIVSMPFGITTAGSLYVGATGNKACVNLSSGTATATVLSGAVCTCGLSVGTVWPKCSVATTTLTITGTGSDTVCYTCM